MSMVVVSDYIVMLSTNYALQNTGWWPGRLIVPGNQLKGSSMQTLDPSRDERQIAKTQLGFGTD